MFQNSFNNKRFDLANQHLIEMESTTERILVDLLRVKGLAAAVVDLVPEWRNASMELRTERLPENAAEYHDRLRKFMKSVGL